MARANAPTFFSALALDVLAAAREAHREGRLGFLVGAGLSRPIGLPGWGAFNRGLVKHSFALYAPEGHPVDELARAYFDAMGGQELAAVDFVRQRARERFYLVLRRALYQRAELQSFAPTEVHYALARLACDSSPPFPCLHTTNYDELLELALSVVAARPAQSVHAGARAWGDGPRVVHLHGYFPHREPKQKTQKELAAQLILSELDYSRLSNDHAAWTNRELLQLLDARSVLIVGMSLTDPNVRRLLAYLSERPRAADEPPRHFVVLTDHARGGLTGAALEAAVRLDEDEYAFWEARNVQILRVNDWDRLNYLLRRIRFDDDEWDAQHAAARAAWAGRHYGGVSFDDPDVQHVGTAALERARAQLQADLALPGRVEINLFLPDGDRYRRALSSIAGRALEAPRAFKPGRAARLIPEVEEALILGMPVRYTRIKKTAPPPGQPPFQEWYRSLLSVPFFDLEAGGIPVAVVQLVAEHEDLEAMRLPQPEHYLRAIVPPVLEALVELTRRSPALG